MGMDFTELQKLLWKEYTKNAYDTTWNAGGKLADLGELGLIVTEIAEGMEELRNKDYDEDKFMFECADIIIRTLNLMRRMSGKFNAENYITKKHLINLKRGKLHGRGI